MLELGWIDFSKEHQSKVMSILDMLMKPGAVDELGISVIRDRFSDIFFPGTSTIQTRAKYFFIVPWLMLELEKEKGINAVDFSRRLHKEEIALINKLALEGEWGVIGIDSREKLKRKPSSIYWNGLRSYDIFKYPKLTLSEYIRVAPTVRNSKEQKLKELKLNSEEGNDDKDAFAAESLGAFWSITKPEEGWKDNISMNLSFEEASFLREKIITSSFSKDSLWAYILRECGNIAKNYDSFEELEPLVCKMPEQIYYDYKLALNFSRIIYGVHIRYNILFFKACGQPSAEAEELWKQWKDEMANSFDFNSWDVMGLFARVKVQDHRLRSFIRTWTEYAKHINSVDISKLDDFIVKREIELKGPERSKLKNSDEYTNFRQNWIGIGKLQFRWPNVKRLLLDILEGLGENNVEAR